MYRVSIAESGARHGLRVFAVLAGAMLSLGLCSAAWAFWTNTGAGEASAATGTLLAPGNVVADAPVNSGTVAVSWSAATLVTGQPATGYLVTRIHDSEGAESAACGTSAASPTSALSCNDLGVADGSYHYMVTALFGSWTARSANSTSVTVINDNSLPTVAVSSISPTPNGNGWNNSSPVTVNLSASAGFGIASITHVVDGGTPVTVLTDTAAVTVGGDGIHTVSFSARDNPGNISGTESVLVRIDLLAPDSPSAPVLVTASDSGASSSDSITKVTAPTLTGTAEAGSTVRLFDGATLLGNGIATGGTYTITSSTLANGSHTITAQATDQAANTGPPSTGTTVTIDTIAPAGTPAPLLSAASDSGTSSSDRLTNVTTPVFTGTAEAGSTVELYSTAILIGSGPTTAGAYSITSTALTTGATTITAKAIDVAGNISVSSPSVVVTIDVTAPAQPGTPVLAAAGDTGRSATDKITSITTPTITGTTTTATTVTLYSTVGANPATVIGTFYAASTSFAIVATALPDATHVITAKATDAAGNLSPVSTSISVVIDTVAPPAPSAPLLVAGTSDTGRSSTDRITNNTRPVVTGTNDSKAIVTLFDAATQIGVVTTTTTTYSITSSLLGAGTHTFSATSVDVAGNAGPASATTTITIDTTAPAVPSAPALAAASDSGASSSDRITRTTVLTFTGTGEDVSYVRLYDGAAATGTSPGPTVSGGAYSGATSTLTGGTHTFTARATDVAGNISAASGSTVVVVDLVVPTVTVNQAAGQSDPTTSSPIGFTVSFSEPVVGFINTDITYTGTALATTAAVSGNGPVYDVLVSGMTKSGTVIPAVVAAPAPDVSRNANTASTSTDATVTYTDIAAPAAPSAPVITTATDSGASNSDGITNNTKPVFTGTAEYASTVKIYRDATQIGSVVVPISGIYSYTTATAFTNGSYTMTATATDPSLNVSPASIGTPVTVDTVAPSVTLNQALGQADPTSNASINFTATFNGPVVGFTGIGYITMSGTALANTFVVTGTGPAYNVAVSGMSKSGTVIPALALGAAKDLAGNSSTVATYTDRTVTYTDTDAPAVSITGFAAAAGQAATINGLAGYGLGDNPTLTVVLCTTNVFPCSAPNTKATLTGIAVNPGTGAWTVTSSALGTTGTLYARAVQTDLTGNTGTSAIAGPLAIP
jgi:hypothetical protein